MAMNNETSALRHILLVDDEEQFLKSVGITLRIAGFSVTACNNSVDARRLLSEHNYSCVLLDIMLSEINGIEILTEIKSLHPETSVIMITAVNDVDTAVECMRLGAFDYLVKPVEKTRLISTISRVFEMVDIQNENSRLKNSIFNATLNNPDIFKCIITRNTTMYAIFQYIEAIATTSMPVLITGETGTGKEMIAHAIHEASRVKGQFVSINIAGLSYSLLNDSLFGHKRGAFTGAEKKREGLVQTAANGTLFLDEIGDLNPEAQIKLLRLLENRSYYPVGSDVACISTARIVVATNTDLELLRCKGLFRNDLYYRLQSHLIQLPPLRQRSDDITLLIDAFVCESAHQLNKPVPLVDKKLYSMLKAYSFPGNVRELKHLLFDAVSTDKTGKLTIDSIKERLSATGLTPEENANVQFSHETDVIAPMGTLCSIKEAEEILIHEALYRANGNQTVAAQLIGLTRSALNKRLTRSNNRKKE
jgi:DNA-binding NtrC family response regulator